jgi:hypothetical protein
VRPPAPLRAHSLLAGVGWASDVSVGWILGDGWRTREAVQEGDRSR